MENERKTTDTNEKSLERRDYSKEYGFLNQLKGVIDFSIFTNPTLTEHHFYSNVARYIDMIQETKGEEWEEYILNFINQIKQFNGEDEYEKAREIDIYLTKITKKWYEESDQGDRARFLGTSLKDTEYLYRKDENGKIRGIFSGIINTAVPERYYGWLGESGLGNKILKENRLSFAKTIREQKETAEKLKKKL